MADMLDPLYKRFPGREEEVQTLFAANNAFNGLCRSFCDLDAELRRLEGGAASHAPGEREGLHRRQSALVQEMLALMQQNLRT